MSKADNIRQPAIFCLADVADVAGIADRRCVFTAGTTPAGGTYDAVQKNTLLVSQDRYAYIATKRVDPTSTVTILEHIMRVNIYTIRTGRPLTIRAVFGLETAGAGGTQRMVVNRHRGPMPIGTVSR